MKPEERRFLKDPDEFVVWTTRLAAWAQQHRTTLVAAGAGVFALALVGGVMSWRAARQAEAASAGFQLAHGKFAARDYAPAALEFETVAREYASTSFGRLAVLYRGHALLQSGDAAGAAAAYQDFLARFDEDAALEQLAQTNLAYAQEQLGDTASARTTAERAAERSGPYRVEALLTYARLSEAAGDTAAAQDAYRKVLAENPDAQTRTFVQSRLPDGGEPPAG
ncbi:MAG TPA: tetratricopeptide repeat protein [Candidatus Limnocylindria bacterium]|nr:tetratricopeptide repeat protein [Candidatus Limnocylindria bacterium]